MLTSTSLIWTLLLCLSSYYCSPIRRTLYRPIVPTDAEKRAACKDSYAAICSADTLISLACINKRLTPVAGVCPRTYSFSPDGVLSFALLQPLPQATNLRDCIKAFESSVWSFPKLDKSGQEIWPQMIWTDRKEGGGGGCSMAGTYPWKQFLYMGKLVSSSILRKPDGISTFMPAHNSSRSSYSCTSQTCGTCLQEDGLYYGKVAEQTCQRCPDTFAETCDPVHGFSISCRAGAFKPTLFGDCKLCNVDEWTPENNQLVGAGSCLRCHTPHCDLKTGGPEAHCSFVWDSPDVPLRLVSSVRFSSLILQSKRFGSCSE